MTKGDRVEIIVDEILPDGRVMGKLAEKRIVVHLSVLPEEAAQAQRFREVGDIIRNGRIRKAQQQ